jgi:hypothetical protein
MSSIPFIAKPILTTRDAIASHVRWKITLLMAARMREPLTERANHSIEHPDECAIRRWLLSQYTLPMRQTPEYLAVLRAHEHFHREMHRIAALINAGEYDSAETYLNSSQSFQDCDELARRRDHGARPPHPPKQGLLTPPSRGPKALGPPAALENFN